MSFKFTLLGLEFNNCDNIPLTPTSNIKSNSSKKISQQEKFSKAVEICHSKTKNKKAFGNCMSRELKK